MKSKLKSDKRMIEVFDSVELKESPSKYICLKFLNSILEFFLEKVL